MAEATFTCPFCNALFDPRAVGRTTVGKTCPRCGEVLPTNLQERLAQLPAGSSETIPSPTRLSNRGIAFAIVAVMIVMAGLGLVFALWTTDFRRRNDFKVLQAEPEELRPPIEWAALGYVPLGCEILAGVHIEDFVSPGGKEGSKLLDPPRPEAISRALERLEKWSGQRVTNFHHVVLALDVAEIIPQVTIVARTHQPYERDELVRTASAKKTKDLHGRPLYAFVDDKIGGGRIWCPDEQTVVLVWRFDGQFAEATLAKLPYPPRPGREAVSESLRDIMTQRLSKQSSLWFVGAGNWATPLTLLNNVPVPLPIKLDAITPIQAFGIGVDLQPSPVLLGHVQGADAKHVAQLKSLLETQIPDATISMPAADAKGAEANWLTFQKRFDVAEVRRRMNGIKENVQVPGTLRRLLAAQVDTPPSND